MKYLEYLKKLTYFCDMFIIRLFSNLTWIRSVTSVRRTTADGGAKYGSLKIHRRLPAALMPLRRWKRASRDSEYLQGAKMSVDLVEYASH